MLGMQIFHLYGNLLTDEACQSWENIVKAHTDTIPWEDLHGDVHEKKAEKNLDLLLGLCDISHPVCILPQYS